MLPNPTRHLQIQFQQIADTSTSGIHPYMYLQVQYQQIADASEPDQASTNPIPANCRCFRTRPGICKSNSSKLQILPTPGYVSTNSYPANCRCFQPQPGICKSNSSKLQMLPTLTRHLQIQFQQVADASDPRICICKFISNKLQMLPTPARHLQIQFQQVVDASTSGVHPYMYLQIQFQQVADASNPDQASVAPKTANQRCPPVNFLLKFAGGHLYCISISSNSYICLFLIHRGLSQPVSWHLFWTFPVFHRFPYALLWKSLPTRPLLLLSVPDGFCPR